MAKLPRITSIANSIPAIGALNEAPIAAPAPAATRLLIRSSPRPVCLAIVLYSAAIALVFVSARYRVVIVPVVSVLAGQGVIELVGLVRQGRLARSSVLCGLGVLVAALSSVPSRYCVEDGSFGAGMSGSLGR